MPVSSCLSPRHHCSHSESSSGDQSPGVPGPGLSDIRNNLHFTIKHHLFTWRLLLRLLGVPEAGVLGWVTEEQLKVDREETGRPVVSWEALLRNCLFSTESEEGRGLIRAFTPPPH